MAFEIPIPRVRDDPLQRPRAAVQVRDEEQPEQRPARRLRRCPTRRQEQQRTRQQPVFLSRHRSACYRPAGTGSKPEASGCAGRPGSGPSRGGQAPGDHALRLGTNGEAPANESLARGGPGRSRRCRRPSGRVKHRPRFTRLNTAPCAKAGPVPPCGPSSRSNRMAGNPEAVDGRTRAGCSLPVAGSMSIRYTPPTSVPPPVMTMRFPPGSSASPWGRA
jgi:hypothetical protein